MKSARILQAVILMVIVASAASCRSSRNTGSDFPSSRFPRQQPYPEYPGYPQYPQYPEYPQTPRYPEYPAKDYPVYNDPNPKNLPPGQAKKIYGGKSAKPYAPGQRKKYGNSGYERKDGNYRRYPDYVYKGRVYPLIIRRTRDMAIYRDRNGRLYYQHPDGVIYWKGYDDRYYLDERYISYARYTQKEYNDWRYKGDKIGRVRDIFGKK